MRMSGSKTVTENNVDEVAEWCGGRVVVQHDALDESVTREGINVPVGDHVERAQIGDMVCRNEDGTFEIFKQEG